MKEMKKSTQIILEELSKKFPGQTDFRRAIIEDVAKSFGYTQKDFYPLLTPANRVKIGTYSLDGLLPEPGEIRGVMAQMEALHELLEGKSKSKVKQDDA